jgi:hypothetical protein
MNFGALCFRDFKTIQKGHDESASFKSEGERTNDYLGASISTALDFSDISLGRNHSVVTNGYFY